MVLVDALLPAATRAQNMLLVVAGSLFVALCAQISLPLPFSPVPVTGQTFAVLLLGATLGARRSAAALLLYLA
ncbi:MAG: biotin transporter BioY, partial [Acidobacteria bacterium]|nr:biotin transporter BioY [Acidobacteriota bacterium]